MAPRVRNDLLGKGGSYLFSASIWGIVWRIIWHIVWRIVYRIGLGIVSGHRPAHGCRSKAPTVRRDGTVPGR